MFLVPSFSLYIKPVSAAEPADLVCLTDTLMFLQGGDVNGKPLKYRKQKSVQ